MRKKIVNIAKIIVMISIVLIIVLESKEIMAEDNIISYPSSYKVEANGIGASSTLLITNKILGAIQVFGAIVSVGALIIIGIKYMLGSVEEKAEYKKTMWPYILGAIMLFAASQIVTAIYNFASKI